MRRNSPFRTVHGGVARARAILRSPSLTSDMYLHVVSTHAATIFWTEKGPGWDSRSSSSFRIAIILSSRCPVHKNKLHIPICCFAHRENKSNAPGRSHLVSHFLPNGWGGPLKYASCARGRKSDSTMTSPGTLGSRSMPRYETAPLLRNRVPSGARITAPQRASRPVEAWRATVDLRHRL